MRSPLIARRYWDEELNPMMTVFASKGKYDDVIDLSIGDPDIPTPPGIIEAAFADARLGHTKYTDPRGYLELREEICRFYGEEYGVPVTPDRVFVTASGCAAMYLVLQAILNEGEEVIIPEPYFSIYPDQVRLCGGVPVTLPTYQSEGFRIDIPRLEQLLTPKTRAIILNSPNNPSGACLTTENMEEIAAFCKAHDVLVLADDIYTNFCYQQPFTPILALPGMAERTVVINSFSKNFIMTGFRIGNIVAPPEIASTVQRINESVIYWAPSISQRAALWALRHRSEIEPEILEIFRRRITSAAGQMNAMNKMSVLPPQGSIYLFPDVSATGLSRMEVCRRLLDEAHVLTLPGIAFGASGEGHLRIACTVSEERMTEALERVRRTGLMN